MRADIVYPIHLNIQVHVKEAIRLLAVDGHKTCTYLKRARV
jgi:hypothetical protein